MVTRNVTYTNATGTKLFDAAPLRIAISVHVPSTNTSSVNISESTQPLGEYPTFILEPGDTLFLSANDGWDLNKSYFISANLIVTETVSLSEQFAEDMVLKVVRDNGFSNITSLPLIIIAGAIAMGAKG